MLVYTARTSPRLQYICRFIFEEIMEVDFLIITDLRAFINYDGVKINYGGQPIANNYVTIGNHGLLFETGIRQQNIYCSENDHYKAFFKVDNADFAFDIFCASFYLLSRYEEYLPHKKDLYGRYAHENSLAFRENFLHLPMINIWIADLVKMIQRKFPAFIVPVSSFTFIPTYDIDMAFSYKHKGWLRNLGGFLKSPSIDRIKVLLGLSADPFDSYKWMNKLHNDYDLQPVYFFLMAEKNGVYDKNILPHKKAMHHLVEQIAQRYKIGIHPSWQTGENYPLLKSEKESLEKISKKKIDDSRQHYIRFTLPDGYRQLLNYGITDDYSMGYGAVNGFRASVATPFYWYDLEKDKPTQLRIHPFCFMDATSFYEQKYTAGETFDELMHYFAVCKDAKGQLVTIWHNNFLGSDPLLSEWKETYRRFIDKIKI